MRCEFAKIISVITVVPIMAFFTTSWIYSCNPSVFGNGLAWYVISLAFLTFVPISAYPLKKIIPKYKNGKRAEERKLAFIMAVVGYVAGLIVVLFFNAPQGTLTIFSSYFLAGVFLTFFNKFLNIKASGHAGGVATPVVLLLHFIGIGAWYSILILPVVFWARMTQKRHTIKELITGTLVGALSAIIACCI